MATAMLFWRSMEETDHLHTSEVSLVRDLFKGHERN